MVTWMIDNIRIGSTLTSLAAQKGTSNTFCLLDMMHTWLSYLDSPNKHLHLFFLHFSKAFDHIGHNVLIRKLVDLGVRRCLIPWIIGEAFSELKKHLLDIV